MILHKNEYQHVRKHPVRTTHPYIVDGIIFMLSAYTSQICDATLHHQYVKEPRNTNCHVAPPPGRVKFFAFKHLTLLHPFLKGPRMAGAVGAVDAGVSKGSEHTLNVTILVTVFNNNNWLNLTHVTHSPFIYIYLHRTPSPHDLTIFVAIAVDRFLNFTARWPIIGDHQTKFDPQPSSAENFSAGISVLNGFRC